VPTTPSGLTQLCQDRQLPARATVALETGSSAFYVARLLATLQLEPVVVDAHEVRRKASRPPRRRRAVRRGPPGILSGGRAHPQPGDSTLRITLSRRRHFIRIQTAERPRWSP
jgi:hypothetical protein